MEHKPQKKNYFGNSHLTILFCYTILSVMLIAESILLSWERWALIPIVAGVILSWMLHIRRNLTVDTRIWIYVILMMMTTFFYGIHLTSTYDLGLLVAVLILIFVSTGIPGIVTLCQLTYYVIIGYNIIQMYRQGETFDSLLITRTILHVVLITVIAYSARWIIRKWVGIMDRSEEEKQALTETADRLNDFLVNISHEIRTPINAVIGLTDVCIENEKDEEVRRNLLSVAEAGKRVGSLTSDILDYSEIDMNSLAVNEEEYMISSLLNDIVAEIGPQKAQDTELVIDVDPSIPSVMRTDVAKLKKILKHLIDNSLKYTREGGVYVRITSEERDYGINLLIEVTDTGIGMNAREMERVFDSFYQADSGRSRHASGLGLGLSIVDGFTRSLKGFLTIESEEGTGTTVRVSIPQKVVDQNSCMSIRKPERLNLGAYLHFEKYSNPNVREFYNAMVQDLVLGLNVTMQRADNVNGFRKMAERSHFTHVFVGKEEYEENREVMDELAKKMLIAVVADDSFTVPEDSGVRVIRKPFYCFPVISFLNMDFGSEPEEKGRLCTPGVRALVVDDEPMNHTVAKEIFSRYGMMVSTANSGYESIDYIRKNEVDIIFMDHMMPGMDGIEAMKRIRSEFEKEHKVIPIVALTANAVSTAKETFLQEGFDAFLAKPIEICELERILKHVLPKHMITIEKPAGGAGETKKKAMPEDRAGQAKKTAGSEDGNGQKKTAGSEDGAGQVKKAAETVGETGLTEEQMETGSEGGAMNDNHEKESGSMSGTAGSEQKVLSAGSEPDALRAGLEQLGIDVDTGLGFCANDMDFYSKLVGQYASESKNRRSDAEKYLNEKDFRNYEIIVHAVKGTSRMIGATELGEMAWGLEQAAKAGDEAAILQNHAAAMEEYKRITDGILELCPVQEEEDEFEIIDEKEEGGEDDWIMEFEPEGGDEV